MSTEETQKPPSLPYRALRAVLGSLPGIGLGVFCFVRLEYALGGAIFMGAVSAFIGAALAQPGVSAANVFTATAGVIVAHNIPVIGERILDTLDENPQPAPAGADPPLACTDYAEFPPNPPPGA